MRPTWIVIGVVAGIGSVAYWKLRTKADECAAPALTRGTEGGGVGGAPASGSAGMASGPVVRPASDVSPAGPNSTPLAAPTTPEPTPGSDESRARALVQAAMEKRAANDAAGAAALDERLEKEFGGTDEFRRHSLVRGLEDAKAALDDRKGAEVRLEAGLRARRTISRALFLPELFDATTGRPTESRVTMLRTLASVQTFVMTRAGGVPGITKPYDVVPGDNPLRIVSRDKLRFGPNALLFWNQGGSFDPRRLKAGDRMLVPQETLSIEVSLERHLLGVYLGESLVKEFSVGVGKSATPTFPGTYEVKDKYLNPDWHSPTGVIPYGDPRNELGDAWIPISSPEKPKGYGIHGTVKPETVGTDCSNGCVRLRNDEAVEMTSWVRTAKGDGQATVVRIR